MNLISDLKNKKAYCLVGWIGRLLIFISSIASVVKAQSMQPLIQVSTDYDFASVSWSPDDELIAVGKLDGTIIYDTNLQEVSQMPGDAVVSVSWNPESTQLATGGGFYANQGEVQIWHRDLNANTFTLATSFNNSHEDVFYVTWSPDGTMLATASRDSRQGLAPIVFTIEIWNTDTWTLKTTLKHQYLKGSDNLSW